MDYVLLIHKAFWPTKNCFFSGEQETSALAAMVDGDVAVAVKQQDPFGALRIVSAISSQLDAASNSRGSGRLTDTLRHGAPTNRLGINGLQAVCMCCMCQQSLRD